MVPIHQRGKRGSLLAQGYSRLPQWQRQGLNPGLCDPQGRALVYYPEKMSKGGRDEYMEGG